MTNAKQNAPFVYGEDGKLSQRPGQASAEMLNVTLMNSSTTQDSKAASSSIFGSVQSPPHMSQSSEYSSKVPPFRNYQASNSSMSAAANHPLGGEKKMMNQGNVLLQDKQFMNYFN